MSRKRNAVFLTAILISIQLLTLTASAENVRHINEGIYTLEGANVRLAADGMSAIVTTLSGGIPLERPNEESDWYPVSVNGQTGYIYKDDLSGVTQTEAVEPKVTIFSSRRSVMQPGETVCLTSKLEGIPEGVVVHYQWLCDKGGGFEVVPGATGPTYEFKASIETLSYSWCLDVWGEM